MSNFYNFKDIKAMQEANDRLLQELERDRRQKCSQSFHGMFPPVGGDPKDDAVSGKEDCSCKHS